jgi:TP901 family phage tail tape measure protein|nr:MAG TPA: tail tape measure protein [Caudoviricetes sp.]
MAKKNTQTANVLLTLDGKQAEKMLGILNKKSETLRDEIRSLNNQRVTIGLSGDEAKRFDALKKEFRDTSKQSRELSRQLADVSGVINNLSTKPINAIKDAIRTVTTQMNRLDRDTEAYAKREKELKLLRAELERIGGVGQKNIGIFDQTTSSLKKFGTAFLAYFGSNMIIRGLRKMYDMNAALSDQLSDIEKTTGITGSELAALSEDINRIDTRTSVEQLNNLAAAAGKLGITGKENVLGFVEAGNMINVALGEDLGEDAIKNIAKLNDVLGITKELGVEKGLLATGSAINELGQSSTASEAYLVDFAQRLGGIASQAGLTIQQVLALGSAADQMGQNVEVSATALNTVIKTLVSKTGQVAKAIGVTKEELQGLLDKSTWDGLLFVFEKLAGKGGLAAIAPLMGDLGSDGARLTQVISALASNTSKLNREIEISNKAFAEGTSVINEYNKKNNNLAGTIEKIGKNIQRWFLGSGVVDWMQKVASMIESLTRGADTAKEKFDNSLKAVRDLTRNISPLIDEYDKLKDSKAADEQQRLKVIMQQIGAAIPQAVTQMDEYGNILAINTDRARAFIESQKLILKQNNKALIDETQKQIDRIAKERQKAAEIVDQISRKGSYTESQTVQTSSFGTSKIIEYEVTDTDKIKAAEVALTDLNSKLREQQAILAELNGNYLDADLEKLKKLTDTNKKTGGTGSLIETDEERKKRLKASLDDVDAYVDQEKTKLIQARINKQKFRDEDIDSEEKYNEMLEKIQFEALNKKLQIAGLDKDKRAEVERQFYDFKLKLFNKSENAEKQWVSSYEKLQDQLGIRSEDKDKRNLARIEVLYDSLIKKAKEGVAANYKSQEEITKDIELFQKEREKAIQGYWAGQDIKSMDQEEAEEKAKLKERFLNREMDYEEYLRREAELENQYAESKLFIEGLTEEQLTDLRTRQQEIRFQNMKQAYDKEKALQQQYANVIENSLKGLGGAFSQLFTSTEDGMGQMKDALIDTLFDSLEGMVDIWLKELDIAAAVNIALGSAKEVGSKGLLGLATAALVSGAIMGFMQVAKAAIKSALGSKKGTSSSSSSGKRVVKGYSVGGYSGDGGTHEVAGVVHKGEYIVPAFQMKDPVSFNYVRALETIRQTRTHANPLPRAGYAEGGPVQSTVPVFAASDPELGNTLKQINVFLQKLDTKQFTTVLNVSRLNDFQNRFSASVARGSRKKSEKSK